MRMDHLPQDDLGTLPEGPGVYLMRDMAGAVIYVGKAQNLRRRLASYFTRGNQPDPKTQQLVSRIARYETILTESVAAALILEDNLIKLHRPRYNVLLKDDKRYPSLRLDVTQAFPTLEIVRQPKPDGALYFGPFPSALSVRETVRLIDRTFHLRKCRHRHLRPRKRPCLHCQMQGCQAPCCRSVDPQQYTAAVQEAILFLRGRTPELVRRLRSEMETAAETQAYERAAQLRDQLFALQKIIDKQAVVTNDFIDRDALGLASAGQRVVIVQLVTRGGQLVGSRDFDFEATLSDAAESLGAFMRQAYANALPESIPAEILVPQLPWDAELLADTLSQRRGERVRLLAPKRGPRHDLLSMANRNAAKSLEQLAIAVARSSDLLERLQRRLGLSRPPQRIECIDNSHLAGTGFVSGIVVFEDGQALRSDYRHFILERAAAADDYAAMAEALERHFKKDEGKRPLPDLLLVDGGRGQLGVALSVLRELGIEGSIELAAIAKPDPVRGESEDRIFRPGRVNPIGFGRDGELLLFLARVRDEAHRWAIRFQRKRRRRAALRSPLDQVPGIGPRRRALLLQHFGSLTRLKQASLEQLCQVSGINAQIAAALHLWLKEQN